MRALLIPLVLFCQLALGVEFNQLSKYHPVETSFIAEGKTYANVSLSISAVKAFRTDIFLRVSYIIGSDTLNDYLKVSEAFQNDIKQVFLDTGEELKVLIYLNNRELDMIANEINGSIEIGKRENNNSNTDAKAHHFVGTIWRSDETPIFRISKSESEPKKMIIKVTFSPNYEYDELYLRAKVISPIQGIVVTNKTIGVNTDEFILPKKKSMEVELSELDVKASGSYYLQLSHLLNSDRINGIESISYELR